MVGGALIDEALPSLIHGQHAGLGAVHHKVREDGLAAISTLADRYRRPEGVRHATRAVMGTEAACQVVRRAGVAGGRRTPARVHAGQHLKAQSGVAVEAAAGQDDATCHMHRAALVVLPQRDGFNTVLIAMDLLDRGVQHQRNMAAFGQGVQQPSHQCIAHHQTRATRIAQAVSGMPQNNLDRMLERCERLRHAQQVVDVGAVHHHAAQHGELGDGGADQLEQVAQQAAVKRQRLQRPSIQRRAAQIGDVVRVFGARTVFKLRVCLDMLDGDRSVVQEGLAQ